MDESGMEFRKKLIVDTDCGVDDAMALLLALTTQLADVVGITCVAGNTSLDNVCNNVKRVLVVCNKTEIPIYKGCTGPLVPKPIRKDSVCHADDGLGGVAHEFSTGDVMESEDLATTALIQLTRKHTGEITLVTLGPLTNVAIAHRLDPYLTERLKAIVCMGGNYKGVGNITEVAEFNFYADPEAADIVLREAACPVLMVPWETTLEGGFTFETYDRQIQIPTSKAQFYRKVTGLLVQRTESRGEKIITDCDLLAVMAAIYPEIISSSLHSYVAVECEGTYTRALTVLLNPEKSPLVLGKRKIQIVTGFFMDLVDKLRLQMLQDGPTDLQT